MHRNKVLQHTTVSALCAKAIFTAFQCLEQSQALAAYNSFCFMHQNKLLQHTTVSVLCTKIKLLQHTSVTFLNSERFLTYCSCPTVRDWIAVHPALFVLMTTLFLFVHCVLRTINITLHESCDPAICLYRHFLSHFWPTIKQLVNVEVLEVVLWQSQRRYIRQTLLW